MGRRPLIAQLVVAMTSVLALAGGGILAAASSARADAPFVALAAGHVGQPYSDRLDDVFKDTHSPPAQAPFKSFRVVQGSLPVGLRLDAATGVISGLPRVARATRLRVAATDQSGADYFVRADLAVFSKNETEIVAGQSFASAGPYSTTSRTTNMSWVSSLDGATYPSSVQIVQPVGTTGKLPLLVFHRGRGLTWNEYPLFLARIASHGIVCASISDSQSFYDPGNPNARIPNYDSGRIELGMENASAAQEGLLDYMLGLSQTPSDSLYQRIDEESIFAGGHSRGGGATHGTHARGLSLRLRGVVYFMAFDLRYFSEVIAPAQAPAYAIPSVQPRLPSLVISAELDGDLTYPYADEIIDRASGPTTFATIYGANHNQLADAHSNDATPRITRQQQQDRIAHLVIAFVKRWANQDLSLEGLLYGSEYATSSEYAIASWRRSSPALVVDDFQDGDASKNCLGGANGVVGSSRSEMSAYPSLGNLATLGIRHSILSLTTSNASFDLDLNGARDVRRNRAVLARVKQSGASGWQVDAWAVLTDAHGNTASVQVARKDGASLGSLPGYTAGQSSLARFLTLSVPLYRFERNGTPLDLSAVTKVSFVFGAKGTTSTVVLDDVRFE